MIELIREEVEQVERWFLAETLEPLQAGVTLDGVVVMRTASSHKLEIMDLSKPGPDACWTGTTALKVRALRPGETYTLLLS